MGARETSVAGVRLIIFCDSRSKAESSSNYLAQDVVEDEVRFDRKLIA